MKNTYNQIKENGDRLCKLLTDTGLTSGGRIAWVYDMCPQWHSMLYAVLKLNLAMVNIDPKLSLPEIIKQIGFVQARVLFIGDMLYDEELLSGDEYISHIPVFSGENVFMAHDAFPSVIEPDLPSAEDTDSEDLFILFSSGTTAESKAVALSRDSIYRQVYCCYLADEPKKTYLNMMPPHHIAGLTFTLYMFLYGSESLVIEALTPTALADAFQEYKPEAFGSVPKVFSVFYDKIIAEIDSKGKAAAALIHGMVNLCGFLRRTFGLKPGLVLLKSINKAAFGGNILTFYGGATSPDYKSMKFFIDMGIDFIQMYGLSETGMPLTATLGKGYNPGTSGPVVDYFGEIDIMVHNPDSNGIGELYVKTPFMMRGYLRNSAMTKDTITPDGYMKTGDLGYFDRNNCLCITGRIKEVVVLSTGEKVSPAAADELYAGIEGIKQSACFSVTLKNNDWDTLHIAAVPADPSVDYSVLSRRVYERSSSLNSKYRVSGVHIIDEIPANSLQKVQRYKLTQSFSDHSSKVLPADSPKVIIGGDEKSAEDTILDMLTKAAELSEPPKSDVLLNNIMDSLSYAQLYANIEAHFGVDIFELDPVPTTVNEFIFAVLNAQLISPKKSKTPQYDIAQFPQPRTKSDHRRLNYFMNMLHRRYDVTVSGEDNIPQDRPFILCPNHQSHADPVWISRYLSPECRERTYAVAKEEHLANVFSRRFLRMLGGVPIDRTGKSERTMQRCAELIEKGGSIIIFPEGTRTPDGTIGVFKTGAATLAIKTNAPLIPACIKGAFEVYPKNQLLPKLSRSKISIAFGSPIYPASDSDKDILTTNLRASVIKLYNEL